VKMQTHVFVGNKGRKAPKNNENEAAPLANEAKNTCGAPY